MNNRAANESNSYSANCCSDPECGRYGCKLRRPPAMYAVPPGAFNSLDPDRNARAMEALATAIARLAQALERSDTSALQQPREAP